MTISFELPVSELMQQDQQSVDSITAKSFEVYDTRKTNEATGYLFYHEEKPFIAWHWNRSGKTSVIRNYKTAPKPFWFYQLNIKH